MTQVTNWFESRWSKCFFTKILLLFQMHPHHSVRFTEPENEPKQIFLTEIFLKDPIEIDLDQINQDKIALAKQHQSFHANGHSDGEKVLETSFRVEKYFSSPKLFKQHSIDEDEPPDLELVDPESMAVIPHVSTSNLISVSPTGSMDKKEPEPNTMCASIEAKIVDNKETEEQETQIDVIAVIDASDDAKTYDKTVSNCDKIETEQGFLTDQMTDKKCETSDSDKQVVSDLVNGTCENGSAIKTVSENESHSLEVKIPDSVLPNVLSEDMPTAVDSKDVSKSLSTVVSTEISTTEAVSAVTAVTAADSKVALTAGLRDGSTAVNQDSFDKSIHSKSISKDSSFEYDEIKKADDEKLQVETSGHLATASTTTKTTTTATTTPPHRFATIKKNIESASTVKESSMGQISRTYKKCKKIKMTILGNSPILF